MDQARRLVQNGGMLSFILIYLVLQVAIGIYASRFIRNEKDYLVAGRNVPSYLLVFSLFATWFGSESIMGTTAAVYEQGLSGSRADPWGYFLCLVLLGLLIAPKLWKDSYLTLGDFYRDRFGPRVEKLVILILFISSLIWASAQIRAFGQVMSYYTAWPLWVGMGMSFTLVVIYSMLGGLIGDILTDFIQALVLLAGLVALLFFMEQKSHSSFLEFWQSLPPERVSWTAPGESWALRVERWMIPALGSLVAQESIQRLLTCRNAQHAKRVTLYSSALYLLAGSIPLVAGLLAPAVLTPGAIDDSERVVLQMAQELLPAWLHIIFVGALVSAILSTVDSILISGGGLVSHNFLIPRLEIKKEKHKVFLTRLSVFLMASLALGMALVSGGIYELVSTASSWGSAGLVVTTLLGLWTPWGGSRTAIFTLLAGIASFSLLSLSRGVETPFTWSVLISLATYLLFAGFESAQKPPIK
jgi:Na+/proline symporter